MMSTYNAKRRWVQALSTVAILVLPFCNVLRLDVPTLRFYFLTTVLWVDEFYLLFLVCMLLLFVVVAFSMVYGRVWCGWMCPQTVLSELIHGIERAVRRKLGLPKSGGKPARRLLALGISAAAAALLSLLVSFNLIAYFVDPYSMLAAIGKGALGPVTTGILAGTALLLFADLMFWREKFCTRTCPYGMLQMVVTDAKTQIVRYQTERAGECIECKACVRDCMMGIDIRMSPYQTECIHCGVCVDSCTAILGRLKKPLPTLISFSWGETGKGAGWRERLGIVDAKRVIVLAVILVYCAGLLAVARARQPLGLSATGDRSTLFRKGGGDTVLNDYQIRISNRSMSDAAFLIRCPSSDPGCKLRIVENPVGLKSREVRSLRMTIATRGRELKPGPNRLRLEMVNTSDSGMTTATDVVFFMPEKGQ